LQQLLRLVARAVDLLHGRADELLHGGLLLLGHLLVGLEDRLDGPGRLLELGLVLRLVLLVLFGHLEAPGAVGAAAGAVFLVVLAADGGGGVLEDLFGRLASGGQGALDAAAGVVVLALGGLVAL